MIKSLISAIGSALRGAFSLLRRVVEAPFRLFGGTPAGTPPAEDSPLVMDLEAQIATNDELKERAEHIARIVSTWCMNSVIAGEPEPTPTPPHVSRAVADWLPGLTRQECLALISADPPQIVAHIRGREPLEGVRAVKKLYPEPWPMALQEREPEPGFMFHALNAAPSM